MNNTSNFPTLEVAISDTDRCVWIVSSWSRHQSSSSSVSIESRMKFSSAKLNFIKILIALHTVFSTILHFFKNLAWKLGFKIQNLYELKGCKGGRIITET